MTRDVYATSIELETNGVKFQKRPNEGRMMGIAFALDPDGYWIEIIRRSELSIIQNKYTLAQTMKRIKDPKKSLHFYCNLLGMTLLFESKHSDFTNYFLAQLPNDTQYPSNNDSENANEFMKRSFFPVLELTHNHGTETNPDFK